MMEVLNKTEL